MVLQNWSAPRDPLTIEYLPTSSLKPNPDNPRRHTSRQLTKLEKIVREVGWTNPIVVDEISMILGGHARWEVARRMDMKAVPCLRLTHLSPAEKTAFAIADNKLGDESVFDPQALSLQLRALADVDFDMELTGFDTGEVDFLLDGAGGGGLADPADRAPEITPDQKVVARVGELWWLGRHRLLCGNALEASSYNRLLGEDRAQMVFTDPPYNVAVNGHVSGLGRTRHREFAMASGEMSEAEFRTFLSQTIAHLAAFSQDGSIHYVCMDWRHIRTLLEASDGYYTELKNICVWNKTNAGMGSLYRSQHELVAVFKRGAAPHQNNVELGRHGRYRTNVWDYPGANAFGPTRDADLAVHPTTKPVALVADAIRDCSQRGAIVLDPFAGSGTTLLAAERAGRKAAAIEIDPLYVDTAIRRWQTLTGKSAVLDGDGRTFAAVEQARTGETEETQDLAPEAVQ